MQPAAAALTPKRGAAPMVTKLPLGGQPARVAPAHVPEAVASAPTPAGAKLQLQHLQRLPRFRPPSFEGLDGGLPCPDSPEGSTPREGPEDEAAVAPCHSEPDAVAGPHQPSRQSERRTQAFPVGSIVEYRSRSSGQWIFARVEAFDEGNQMYRLDVQPHAQPDRVRARGAGGSGCPPPPLEPQPTRSQTIEAPSQAPPPLQAPSQAPLQAPLQHQPTLPRALEGSGQRAAGSDKQTSSSGRASPEIDSLRRQVSRLQAENAALQDRLAGEQAMKDQYFAELCSCREQLHMVRGCL